MNNCGLNFPLQQAQRWGRNDNLKRNLPVGDGVPLAHKFICGGR